MTLKLPRYTFSITIWMFYINIFIYFRIMKPWNPPMKLTNRLTCTAYDDANCHARFAGTAIAGLCGRAYCACAIHIHVYMYMCTVHMYTVHMYMYMCTYTYTCTLYTCTRIMYRTHIHVHRKHVHVHVYGVHVSARHRHIK